MLNRLYRPKHYFKLIDLIIYLHCIRTNDNKFNWAYYYVLN